MYHIDTQRESRKYMYEVSPIPPIKTPQSIKIYTNEYGYSSNKFSDAYQCIRQRLKDPCQTIQRIGTFEIICLVTDRESYQIINTAQNKQFEHKRYLKSPNIKYMQNFYLNRFYSATQNFILKQKFSEKLGGLLQLASESNSFEKYIQLYSKHSLEINLYKICLNLDYHISKISLLDQISKIIFNSGQLEELSLKFIYTPQTDMSFSVRLFSMALKNSKKLKKLALKFSNNEMRDQEFELIIDSIKSLNNLQELQLSLSLQQITGESGIIFAQTILKLTKLVDLRLFINDTLIDDRFLEYLAPVLVNTKKLESLSFDFGRNHVSDSAYEKFNSVIYKGKKNLEKLELSYLGDNITQFTTILHSNTLAIPNIINLKLNIQGILEDRNEQQTFKFFSTGIPELKNLEELIININLLQEYDGSQFLNYFALGLSKLKTLKFFCLDIEGTIIAGNSIVSLVKSLGMGRCLQQLKLDFGQSTVSIKDETLSFLGLCISNNLLIKYLILNFQNISQGYGITDRGLEYIFNSIKTLKKSIQVIDLNLSNPLNKFTDQGIQSLSDALFLVNDNIDEIKIDLRSDLNQFTDKCLQLLTRGIKLAPLLRKLSLKVNSVRTKMTDMALIKFGRSVSKLKKLESFEFHCLGHLERRSYASERYLASLRCRDIKLILSLGPHQYIEQQFQ